MNRIVFPIGPESQGEPVTNLQVALRFLIDDGFFGFNQDEREVFTRNLDAESAAKSMAPPLSSWSLFSKMPAFRSGRLVNEKTAIELNQS